MTLRSEATLVGGAVLAGLTTCGVLVILQAPAWVRFFLDASFWFCGFVLATGIAVLLGIYSNRIGTSRHSRASLCVLVLLLCAFAFPAMEQTNAWIQSFAHDPDKGVRLLIFSVDQFMRTGMQVLTLGLAALAVNLLAGTFPSPT